MKLVVALAAAALASQAALAQPPGDAAQRPAKLDDPVVRPDPRTEKDAVYETTVLGAFRAEQGEQGPLDGRWQVMGANGAAIYTLQLHDPGAGESRIEGAWRDPHREGPGSSGFIDSIWRDADDVVFAFRDGSADGPLTQLRLRPTANGGWTGEKVVGEVKSAVIASRSQGVETAAMAAPVWTPPKPPPAPPKAKAKTKSKAKVKTNRRRR